MAYKKEIDTLVGEILESYGRHPETCSINMRNRVNKEIVIDILEEIRCIVFPGYFEVKNLNENSIEYHVGELLEDISFNAGGDDMPNVYLNINGDYVVEHLGQDDVTMDLKRYIL